MYVVNTTEGSKVKIIFENLQNTELFCGIPADCTEKMLTCMNASIRSFSKGEFLMRAGEKPTSIGLVVSGEVHIVKEDFWGNNFILTDVKPGYTFAEASAIAGEQALLFGAVAKEPTVALFLPVARLRHTCSENCGCHQKVIENLLSAVADRNLTYERKCEHLSRRTTREKLLSFLSEQSTVNKSNEFSIPYNRQQLADYLSVDRSAMSSELGHMQAEGLLRFEKNRFLLLRLDGNPIGKTAEALPAGRRGHRSR